MIYRAGWAVKENQERILAITLPMVHFKTILQQATITSFDENLSATQEKWKQERKAIQLGMKGDILREFCTAWVTVITDITDFVREEHKRY